jgi:hypothetical protein
MNRLPEHQTRLETGDPGSSAAIADRPVGEVLAHLWENTQKLVQQELALAKTELELKLRRVKAEAAAIAVGGALLHTAALSLAAAAILLLSQVMLAWLAAAVVAIALGAAGAVLLKRGSNVHASELAPTHTIENVRRDVKAFTENSQ